MTTTFRHRLRAGELLIGAMVTLGAPEVAEIMAGAGFDWLFLDAEHGALTAPVAARLVQAAGPGTPCLVRLATTSEEAVKQALDAGAAGVIAPMVNTAAHAAKVVSLCKYPPQGRRSIGLGRATAYGQNLAGHLAGANEGTAVVVQAEHRTAVENIEAIAAVAGVDAVFIGPYDLSASLGRPGQVDHPAVQAAIARVGDVCTAAGMPLGVFGVTAERVRPYIDRGYTLVTCGADVLLLGNAARQLLAQVRAASGGSIQG